MADAIPAAYHAVITATRTVLREHERMERSKTLTATDANTLVRVLTELHDALESWHTLTLREAAKLAEPRNES